MTVPVLATKHHTGVPIGLFSVQGATPSAVGVPHGVAEPTGGGSHRRSNTSLQFGQNFLLDWIGNSISQSSDGGASWTVVLSLSPALPGGSEFAHTGLHVVTDEATGAPRIIGMYRGADNSVYGVKSYDGVTWTRTAALLTNAANFATPLGAEIVFQNILFTHNPAMPTYGHFAWDASNDTISSSAPAGMSSGSTADFCFFKGRLYKLNFYETNLAATRGYLLYEFAAGTWISRGKLPSDGQTTFDGPIPVSAHPILYDGADGSMYAIWYSNQAGTPDGWVCTQIAIDSNGGVAYSDVTAGTLPLSLKWGGCAGSASTGRWTKFLDEETNAPTPVLVQLWYSISWVNALINFFRWNGCSALIGDAGAPNGIGGDVSMVLPNLSYGGAERVWTFNGFAIRITGKAITTGGVRYSFKVCGPAPANQLGHVQLFFSKNTGQIPTVIGTVSNPMSGGPAPAPTLHAGGQQLDNVTSDGLTTFSLDWQAQADGVAIGDLVKVALRFFTP